MCSFLLQLQPTKRRGDERSTIVDSPSKQRRDKRDRNSSAEREDFFAEMVHSEFHNEFDELDELFGDGFCSDIMPPREKVKKPVRPAEPQAEISIDSEQVFQALHPLYEDIKLNKFLFSIQGKRLAKFLVQWILNGGEKADEFIFQESSSKSVV